MCFCRHRYSFLFNVYTWKWNCWAIRHLSPICLPSISIKPQQSLETVFQNGCDLYSCQQCMRIPAVVHPPQHLASVLSVLLVLAIQGEVWQCLNEVFICIYLLIDGIKHLCLFLLANYMPSFVKCLVKSCVVVVFQPEKSAQETKATILTELFFVLSEVTEIYCWSLLCIITFSFLYLIFH